MIKFSLPGEKALLLIALIATLALMSKITQAADSPWPQFGHDSKHTNVSTYDLGKNKKEVLWSYKTGASVESSPAIGSDGTICVGSHDGYFYAFEKGGLLKWKVKLTDPSFDPRWNTSKAIMASPAIAKDGTIYAYAASNFLHALNPDGTEKWRFPVKWHNDFWSSPNIGPDGTIYIGSARDEGSDNKAGLYAINPDGTQKWFVREPSGVTVVPTIADDGTVIYGAANPQNNKGRIKALTLDGKLKWEFVLLEWLEGPAAIGPDGTIFTGSKEGDFYALNPNGTEKWRFKTKGGISAAATIGGSETVYIPSWDGNLYALDQKTGKEKWHYDAKVGRDPKLFEGYPGKETLITNAPLSKDGVLVFGDAFDTIYALDTNGKELWKWKNVSGASFSSTPAIGSDGTMYFGDGGGNFIALSEKGTSQAAKTTDELKKDGKSSIVPALLLFAAVLSVVISAGVIFVLHRKKKLNTKSLLAIILIVLTIVVAYGALLISHKLKNDTKSSEPKDVEDVVPTGASDSKNDDSDFIKNSTRVSDMVDVRVREFGETGRSCAGKGCGSLKDTCVKWNKTKDKCYETVKTSPATSDKYKIYCNMVVVNQDRAKAANISLNLNYTTADGVKHLVKNETFSLKSGTGNSLSWTYEVASAQLGTCGYSDILVTEAK